MNGDCAHPAEAVLLRGGGEHREMFCRRCGERVLVTNPLFAGPSRVAHGKGVFAEVKLDDGSGDHSNCYGCGNGAATDTATSPMVIVFEDVPEDAVPL